MKSLTDCLMKAVGKLPRAQLAGFAREVLAKLASEAELAASNQIVHGGEVLVFTELDSLLAKIEAEPAGS